MTSQIAPLPRPMTDAPRRGAAPTLKLAAAFLMAGLAAGCTSTGAESGGNVFTNMIFYGGPTVPPVAPDPVDDIECPQVMIADGGAALRLGGPDASAVRHQMSITNVARECTPGAPGSGYRLKVGVEGMALLGPAGGGARSMTAPVQIVVKDGDRIIAQRSRSVAITIPAGQAQTSFIAIEDGIVVPGGVAPTVEVGLGSPQRTPARRPRG